MDAMIGVLFAVLLGLIAVPTYIHYEEEGVNDARIVTTAEEMQLMSQAATSYIQANYNNMTLPTDLTVSQLQQAQYLPNSFSPTNPYGQTWQVQVVASSTSQAGLVEALVTTSGGNPIPEKDAPEIAAQAGAQGGFVPYPGQYGSGTSSNVAMGAYGGWQVPLNSPLANPGSGHLMALLYFNNGTLENDYLYRVAVPGQPQLNSMATALNMSANNIAQANVAQAQVANLGMDNGTAVVGSACSPSGAIAAEAPTAGATSTPGNLVNCVQSASSTTRYAWEPLGGGGMKPCGSPMFFTTVGTQTITVPSACTAVDAIVAGSGGSAAQYAQAGNGALIQGEVPVSAGSSLTVLVGGGATAPSQGGEGGGGGLSAVCNGGSCTSSSALLVAGGGGGAAVYGSWNSVVLGTTGPTYGQISNAGPDPALPPETNQSGGNGDGGAGATQYPGATYYPAAGGAPWADGGAGYVYLYNGSPYMWGGSGGFGGGGGGGINSNIGGGGGGGGMPGGDGSDYASNVDESLPGQGGTDYVAPSVFHVIQITGGGGAGANNGGTDNVSPGQNGYVILQFLQ